MEKIEKYLSDEADETFRLMGELKSLPIEQQRFIYFSSFENNQSELTQRFCKLRNGVSVIKYFEDDERISIYYIQYNMFFNKKVYFRTSIENGLTYNKKKSKISAWYGKPLHHGLIKSLMEYRKVDWFLSMPLILRNLSTKTMIEKIIAGKITNPEQYIKMYCKISLKYNFPYRLLKEYFENNESFDAAEDDVDEIDYRYEGNRYMTYIARAKNTFYIYNKIRFLYLIKDYTVNPSYTLECFINRKLTYDYMSFFYDMLQECQVADYKINVKWSIKRLTDEHSKLSMKIAKIKIQGTEKKEIPFFGNLEMPDDIDMSLIDDNYKVFYEGENMRHCIYTNYLGRAMAKKEFYFSVKSPERCTFSVVMAGKYGDEKFQIGQIRGFRNKSVLRSTEEKVAKWLELPSVQMFFKTNYLTDTKEEYIKNLIKGQENTNSDNFNFKQAI